MGTLVAANEGFDRSETLVISMFMARSDNGIFGSQPLDTRLKIILNLYISVLVKKLAVLFMCKLNHTITLWCN